MKTREQWLQEAKGRIAEDLFAEQGYSVPEVKISTGFSSKGARSKVIGECHYMTADKVSQIFITPTLSESQRVLDVLVHELVHATLGAGKGHKAEFKRCAVAVGLTGQMTATEASETLKKYLDGLVSEIGEYPHALLAVGGKKQTTRLVKCECSNCGYICRTTAKWIDEIGAPICSCNMEEMEVKA